MGFDCPKAAMSSHGQATSPKAAMSSHGRATSPKATMSSHGRATSPKAAMSTVKQQVFLALGIEAVRGMARMVEVPEV